ncbi:MULTISPECIES: sulfotransferase [Cupriavidus]|nr:MULTISPECIES: sulfotransferase [Cupriavidus]MCO4865836.1 sulfotransferase [Cupriavidus sp. WGlv3]MCO4893507.1 sulfotransferase [Cupriavidus sp. WGtm5]SOY74898.1 NodH sulfotransferase [Cupriavidus taiwanensis]SOZ75768.1 NodH sulfotransferase [Cupriavidus taiwanensis]SOZ96541.1 NodH sulfotransferase [Cupriavidus taiwanensis]
MPTAAPFVILGMPRTGTHYLEELLNLHPNVSSNGELLNPYDMNWPDNSRLLRSDRDLLELAYQYYPTRSGKTALTHVGCKINQPQFRERPGFFETLIGWPHLRAIFVRRNSLESLRSLVQARTSGQWLQYGTCHSLAVPPNVTLTIDECEAYFRIADDFHTLVANSFQRDRIMTIDYEDLLRDPAPCLDAIWFFLGTSPHACSVRTALRRQEMRPLRETVCNFVELKRHFSGGPHTSYFEA